MKKVLTAVILCVLLAFSLCSCSSNDKEAALSTEQTETQTEIQTQTQTQSENTAESQTVTEEKTETEIETPIPYKITQKEAQAIAFKALKKQSAEGEIGRVEDFTLDDTTLLAENEGFMAYNNGYRDTAETENLTGHSYYVVEYKYTPQLCDWAYYCIDAMNGDVLFEGYMGD